MSFEQRTKCQNLGTKTLPPSSTCLKNPEKLNMQIQNKAQIDIQPLFKVQLHR